MDSEHNFDIALSFSGEDRVYVDQVANLLRDSGVKVFYDGFEEANLWGKNLYDYLSDIYTNKAAYTILFISDSYNEKMWTNHERQAMQARAFQENQEYILPARFDDTIIPGIHPTTGYISLINKTPHEFVEIIHKKLVYSGRTVPSESTRKSFYSTISIPRITPKHSTISIRATSGHPIVSATIIAIAENNTTRIAFSNDSGEAELIIPTRRMYQLLISHHCHPGAVVANWDPTEDIEVILADIENIGSVLIQNAGYIPGLEGRLNPIFDASDRTYLYADNIAISGGKKQPVAFCVNEPFLVEDSNGVIMELKILHIQGNTTLVEFIQPKYNN